MRGEHAQELARYSDAVGQRESGVRDPLEEQADDIAGGGRSSRVVMRATGPQTGGHGRAELGPGRCADGKWKRAK